MDRLPLQDALELQLHQLPDGTHIVVQPIPLAPEYRKADGRWIPLESNPNPRVFEHPVYDEFYPGSMAICPDGIRYVKAKPSAKFPLGSPPTWLRVDSLGSCQPRPLHLPLNVVADNVALPDVEQDFKILGDVVANEDFPINFLTTEINIVPMQFPWDMTTVNHYPMGSYDPLLGNGHTQPLGDSNTSTHFSHNRVNRRRLEESPLVAPRLNASHGNHHMFNDKHVSIVKATCQPLLSHTKNGELQDFPANVTKDRFTIYFNRERGGIPMTLEHINTLDDGLPAFKLHASLGTKASIRFKFKYWKNVPSLKGYVDMRKQVKVRRGQKNGTPISLRAMARLIHSELSAEMRIVSGLHNPLLYRGAPVPIEDFVLVRIERITSGTLQPVFAVKR